jgi:hypothetical protein
MSDDTPRGGADQSVVVGEMANHTPDDGAFDATLRFDGAPRDCDQRESDYEGFHRLSFSVAAQRELVEPRKAPHLHK